VRRKRVSLLVVLILVGAAAWYANEVNSGRRLAPWTNPTLYGITSLDGLTIVGVGGETEQGSPSYVARSEDGGASWALGSAGASSPLPSLWTVAMRDARHLVAASRCTVGAPNAPLPPDCLYASSDGGSTWQSLGVGPLVDPSFSDSLHGWAHWSRERQDRDGSASAFFATADGGLSWQAQASPCADPTPVVSLAVALGPGAGFVACVGPNALRVVEVYPGSEPILRFASTDTPGAYGAPFAMSPDGRGALYLDTPQPPNRILLSTADGARTWTPMAWPSRLEISGMAILPGGSLLVSAWSPSETTVTRTSDGGATWTTIGYWGS
jgi:photosystem II stability/assembly factor-like uncharacterized protein